MTKEAKNVLIRGFFLEGEKDLVSCGNGTLLITTDPDPPGSRETTTILSTGILLAPALLASPELGRALRDLEFDSVQGSGSWIVQRFNNLTSRYEYYDGQSKSWMDCEIKGIFRSRKIFSFYEKLSSRIRVQELHVQEEEDLPTLSNDLNGVFLIFSGEGGNANHVGDLSSCLCCSRPDPGSKIAVESTPFGDACPEVFHRSRSSGTISNAAEEYSIFTTDAQTMIDSEGSPVFRVKNVQGSRSSSLIGMVLTPILWVGGEWLGFTICVHLGDLFNGSGFKSVLSSSSNSSKSVLAVYSGSRQGSGFAIADGLALTCAHVLEDEDPGGKMILIRDPALGSVPELAEIVFANRSDYPFDLAVLKLSRNPHPRFEMSPADPELGQAVIGIGHHGLDTDHSGFRSQPSVTRGEIIGIKRVQGRIVLFLTNCSVQSGMSGGPILDNQGRVLGVMTSHVQDQVRGVHYPNLNFAIPISVVRESLDDFVQEKNLDNLQKSIRVENENLKALWSLDKTLLSKL